MHHHSGHSIQHNKNIGLVSLLLLLAVGWLVRDRLPLTRQTVATANRQGRGRLGRRNRRVQGAIQAKRVLEIVATTCSVEVLLLLLQRMQRRRVYGIRSLLLLHQHLVRKQLPLLLLLASRCQEIATGKVVLVGLAGGTVERKWSVGHAVAIAGRR